ncbi:hypothetical protein ACILDU_08185 [Capnocytophaga canimorsus]|uniref:hypothetical protein n=1 Tax=Capnocytophaga canimorsus TaxID=28188 RepID=UPI0037CFB474
MGVSKNVPDFINEFAKEFETKSYFMSDKGIVLRFSIEEVSSENLTEEKLGKILQVLSCKREERDFLYYTETNSRNPLFDKPIIDIGENKYQTFEPKQILYAIDNLLENTCKLTDKFVKRKGSLLETKIIRLFKQFFKGEEIIFSSYFINNCEQDILILWKEFAFIIESKDFIRIKRDFDDSIGYVYT